jgi:glutaminyl-tRNA synthetase
MKMIHSFSVVCFSLSGALKRFVDPTIAITRHKHSTSKKVTSTTLSTDEVSTMTRNFITNIIDDDLKHMRNGGRVLTRFPPEPNGYLHLGHAKSICLNFGISKVYNGTTNMRFDDTNPEKENMEYINSILRDVRWLIHGDFDKDPWNGEIKHASDYFESIYQAAVYLIKSGLAYVDDLSQGTLS